MSWMDTWRSAWMGTCCGGLGRDRWVVFLGWSSLDASGGATSVGGSISSSDDETRSTTSMESLNVFNSGQPLSAHFMFGQTLGLDGWTQFIETESRATSNLGQLDEVRGSIIVHLNWVLAHKQFPTSKLTVDKYRKLWSNIESCGQLLVECMQIWSQWLKMRSCDCVRVAKGG